MPEWRSGLVRAALAALLIGAYVGSWLPMRTVLTTQLAAPALRAVETPRAAQFAVRGRGMMIQVHGRKRTAGFRATGGLLWLVPALVLLTRFPRRPYWCYLWLLHLGMGALSLGALAAGLAWSDAGFVVNDFWRTYALPAISFAVPVLMWRHGTAAADRDA